MRRVSIATVAILLVSLAAPAGAIPLNGRFPLTWLYELASLSAAWADDPAVPQQRRGVSAPQGHYVSRPFVPDNAKVPPAQGELAPHRPYQPSTGVRTAGHAQGFHAQTSTRLARESTATSDVFANADGSYTRRVYSEPVNFKAADGTWQAIDSTLRVATDGRLVNTANSIGVSLSGGTTSGSSDLVRVTLGGGRQVAYRLNGALVGTPRLERNTATYRLVYPGVDLELAAHATGAKETLVLWGPDVPAGYEVPLRLTGLTARLAKDGGVEFVDNTGTVAGVMPHGYMVDSATDVSGAGAFSAGVTYGLSTVDGVPTLTVTLDRAWLRDPARRFPIRVDPSIQAVGTLAGSTNDTYVQSNDSAGTAANRYLEDNIATGTFDGTTQTKAYTIFPNFPTVFAGKRMSAATLFGFLSYQGAGTGCVARQVFAHAVTSSWQPAGITYATRPSLGVNIGSAWPNSAAACGNTAAIRNVGTWVEIGFNANAANEWATVGDNFGLALTATGDNGNSTDAKAFKRFTSANSSLICPHGTYGNIQCDPFIEVTYTDNVPPVLTERYPPNNAAVNTLTPELLAAGFDPDNWPNKGFRYLFTVYNAQGAAISASGWITSGIWKVPSGVLSWGQIYLYDIHFNDYSSHLPLVKYAFTTQAPQPMVTSSLAQNGGKGFEANVGNYTTSAIDAQVSAVGPALAINRDYNSLDTRLDGAFGRGWSSTVDMSVRETNDAAATLQTVVVRYPSGQDIAFGRNANGVFVAPLGRFAVLKPITGGYSMTDKNATVYEFTQANGAGSYRLTKITDASGRALTLHYDANGRVDELLSVASNRRLTLVWTQPVGSAQWHVSTVTTDPVTPGVPASALTWTYTYDADRLTAVCPPGSTVDCTRYEYTTAPQHASSVLNVRPYSFWRLNEAPGATTAVSSVLSNDGTDGATYANVTLGGAGPAAGSTSTSAEFNGTSSSVQLPTKTTTQSGFQSVSMWFKTSTPLGILYSYQKDPLTPAGTTTNVYNPALYIGSDGKLRGEFWMGAPTPITGPVVTDGQWHHVTLAAHGNTQTLYLDGAVVGSLAGTVGLYGYGATNAYLGGGYIGSLWPSHPNGTGATGYATYFTGSIADVAFFNRAVTAAEVSAMYASGTTTAVALNRVTSPGGRVRAEVTYDSVTGRVATVTDENGGAWGIGAPAAGGSSQVYVSSVLGSQPLDYWRLADIAAPAEAVNAVKGDHGVYHDVTFNTTQPNTTSPFADSFGANFNGTSSWIEGIRRDEFGDGPVFADSVELWFKVPAGRAVSGVLFGYMAVPLGGGNPALGNWTPALYVGADGRLRGQLWTGTATPITSGTLVNDGNWHHAVLATSDNRQTLYLDGTAIGTLNAPIVGTLIEHTYVGAGVTKFWPSSSGDVSYFSGNIAEVALYDRELSPGEVDAHVKASKSAVQPGAGTTGSTLTPVSTVTITDPTGQAAKQIFDVVNGNRMIAATDTLGNTTTYGYDVGGYETIVYDPLGQKTVSGRDARGNTIRSTTCENQSMYSCTSLYYRYWPDATTTNLTPDARNDQVTDIRGARSFDENDNRYLTHFDYDTAGNRTKMTTPAVLGSPLGRATTMTYTTTSTPALGGGTTPAGLPKTVTSAGGAVQSTEYSAAGDVLRVTDPAGLVTEFTYDGLGRTTSRVVKAGGTVGDLTTTYAYDGDGQLVQQVEPSVLNSVTGATHTARTTTTYDADGYLTYRKVEDLTGGDAYRDATTSYNELGQLVRSVDTDGVVTLYEYDAYGNNTKTTVCDNSPDPGDPCPSDDRLRVLTQTFDSEGHPLVTTLTGADGTVSQLSAKAYYPTGELATDTDAMNWVTRYEYDNAGHVTRVTRTDGVQTYVVRDDFYFGNQLSQRESENGALTEDFSWDEAGRLESSWRNGTSATNRMTNYVYDADDHVTVTRRMLMAPIPATPSVQFTLFETTENSYDPMGRITAERTSTDPNSRPIAWWKFNELSGDDATDSSGSHLTAWHPFEDEDGVAIPRSDGAAVINNLGTFETGSPAVNTTESFTVSAWVKVNNFTKTQSAIGQAGFNQVGYVLHYNRTLNKWAFAMPSSDSATPSTTYTASSSNALAANTWVHLVGVFDAPTKGMKLYVNGALGGTATNLTPWNAPTPTYVGGVHFNVNHQILDGAIDNVQMYQRALSAVEVSTLYGGGAGRNADVYAATNQITTSYVVDQRGLTISKTDPNNKTSFFEYDSAGQLVKSLSPSIQAETFSAQTPTPVVPVAFLGYNTFGEQTELKDPLGNTTTTHVDAMGRPIQTILPTYTPPGGSPIVGADIMTEYDKLGQVTSTMDPRDQTTTYEYDLLGNVTTVTRPLGNVSTAGYDGVGNLIESTDPTGARTTATYDMVGRMLTSSVVVRQPTPQTNTTTYDYGTGAYGTTPWLQKVTTQDNVSRGMTYNKLGDLVSVRDGGNNTTTMEYDGLGRLVRTVNPDNTKETVAYDALSRVVSVRKLDAVNAVQTTESLGYDTAGNLTSTVDARGHTTTYAYNALNRLTSEVQPVTASTSITTSFGYDVAGNRTRFTDGRGSAFWSTYNAWGLPESSVEPSTVAYPGLADRTFTVAYDEAGRPVSQVLPGGVSVTSTFDDLGRLTGQTGAGAEATTVARSYGYDDAGRLTSYSVPGGTDTVTYDDRGLPLTVAGPNNTASFAYTRDGRMSSRTDAAGTTNYTYDTAGRLASVANASRSLSLSVGYNSMNQVSSLIHGGGNVRSFTYDALHRLKTDTLKNSAGTTTIGSITYGYDPNGNETSKVTTGFAGASANTYTYDFADRLTSWHNGTTTIGYGYDDAGNRTQNGSTFFTYDARNQLLTQTGGTTYAYSARGTLRQTVNGSGTLVTEADAFGQVVTQDAAGGTSANTYDALGRAVRTGFAYSGLGNTLAQDADATYTRDPGGGLVGTNSAYVWTDQHLDVVGQFSATGTTLTGSVSYDPLGAVIAGSSMVGHLGYQSEWTDTLTGRVNMLARWYNTDTGQFDSRDTVSNSPVPDSVTANRFQYGDANPLTTVDPTGHWGWSNFTSAVTSVARAVVQPVVTAVQVTANAASTAFNYVASGEAWQDLKAGANYLQTKATQAFNVVKDATVRWAKNKYNQVKDAYNSAKKCLSAGVTKCVTDTAKNALKNTLDGLKDTWENIKNDPWKFVASAAVGLAATLAVGALCATGVGCLLVVGAVAGAMSAGAGYMVDVAQGDQQFSWSGLAGTMVEGGLDGALSAGVSRFTGGMGGRLLGGAGSRLLGGGGARPGGGAGRPDVTPAQRGSGGGAAAPGRGPAGAGGPAAGASRRSRDVEGSSRSTGCAGTGHSFDPATPVLMASGEHRAIGLIVLGDEVVATDPESGLTQTKPVVALHINQDRELTDVTVEDHLGRQATLHTTKHHPFWDATTESWVEAGDLSVGHRLQSLASDSWLTEVNGAEANSDGNGPGDVVVVRAVENSLGAATMFDLTVADLHTYHVFASDTAILVHNCGPDPNDPNIYLDEYEHDNSTRYRGLDGLFRPQGAATVITPESVRTRRGSEASDRITPPGWGGDGNRFNQARGHLIANILGGTGLSHKNLVTLTQNPYNTPMMRVYESQVRDRARAGETIQYSSTPKYWTDYDLVPYAIELRAYGNQGFALEVDIPNPAAWQ